MSKRTSGHGFLAGNGFLEPWLATQLEGTERKNYHAPKQTTKHVLKPPTRTVFNTSVASKNHVQTGPRSPKEGTSQTGVSVYQDNIETSRTLRKSRKKAQTVSPPPLRSCLKIGRSKVRKHVTWVRGEGSPVTFKWSPPMDAQSTDLDIQNRSEVVPSTNLPSTEEEHQVREPPPPPPTPRISRLTTPELPEIFAGQFCLCGSLESVDGTIAGT